MDPKHLTCVLTTVCPDYLYHNFCIFTVALVLVPLHKTVKSVGNLDSEFGYISNSVIKIPNLIKIRSVVFELKHSDCRPAEGYS
jgi:hypothetical protein